MTNDEASGDRVIASVIMPNIKFTVGAYSQNRVGGESVDSYSLNKMLRESLGHNITTISYGNGPVEVNYYEMTIVTINHEHPDKIHKNIIDNVYYNETCVSKSMGYEPCGKCRFNYKCAGEGRVLLYNNAFFLVDLMSMMGREPLNRASTCRLESVRYCDGSLVVITHQEKDENDAFEKTKLDVKSMFSEIRSNCSRQKLWGAREESIYTRLMSDLERSRDAAYISLSAQRVLDSF